MKKSIYPLHRGTCRQRGFTLIEVMIVVAVIAILAAIAYPSYTRYVLRAKRADAKQQLLQAAQWTERYMTANGQYPPGSVSLPSGLDQSPSSGTASYTIGYSARTAATYTLQATPSGASADDECGTLAINQKGVKTASGKTSASNASDATPDEEALAKAKAKADALAQVCWSR